MPVGLPDPQTLARLANAFFSSLPGGASSGPGLGVSGSVPSELSASAPALPASTNPAPPGSPFAGPRRHGNRLARPRDAAGQSPGGQLRTVVAHPYPLARHRAPSLLPHAAAQNGLPDNVVSGAPAADSRYGGIALGVPEAAAAHAPGTVSGGGAPAPGASPYYFLDPAALLTRGPAVEPPVGVPAADFASLSPFLSPADPSGGIERVEPTNPARASHGASVSPFGLPRGASEARSGAANGPSRYFLETLPAHAPEADPAAPEVYRSAAQSAHPPFDVHAIRRDFPILQERVNGGSSSGSTTRRPRTSRSR